MCAWAGEARLFSIKETQISIQNSTKNVVNRTPSLSSLVGITSSCLTSGIAYRDHCNKYCYQSLRSLASSFSHSESPGSHLRTLFSFSIACSSWTGWARLCCRASSRCLSRRSRNFDACAGKTLNSRDLILMSSQQISSFMFLSYGDLFIP